MVRQDDVTARAEYHRGDTNLREMYRLVLERRSQSVVDRREVVTSSFLSHLVVYISYTSPVPSTSLSLSLSPFFSLSLCSSQTPFR